MLVVIEGTDGAGKASQTRMLRAHLEDQGHRVTVLHFPRYNATPSGKLLRDALRAPDAMNTGVFELAKLFAKDRAESREELQRALDRGDWVVCDRYVASNQAYGGARLALARKSEAEIAAFRQAIEALEYEANRMPRPGAVFLLDVPPETAAARVEQRGDEQDQYEQRTDLQVLAREQYLKLAAEQQWATLDGSLSPADVHTELVRALSRATS